MTSPMAAEEIQRFVTAWFRALDVHASPQECLTFLADGLKMHVPEGDIPDLEAFKRWYDRVVTLFFDEEHTIRSIDMLDGDGDSAKLHLRVRWQSGWWEPPAPASKRIDLEVDQLWTVRRCPQEKNAFGLEIVDYVISDDLVYATGSAVLPPVQQNDRNDLIELNERIGEMEQASAENARTYFSDLLSDQLVFRRANGKTVGKSGEDGFLSTLGKSPYWSRRAEDISVAPLGDRALVTLIVVGTLADKVTVQRYRNIRLFTRSAAGWVVEFWYNYDVTTL
jgi:hypothetical protein